MAYFGANYPATYQPMFYPSVNQQAYSTPSQAAQNGVIWVQGEAGAKSYLVAPNTTVQLWDSETQRIFLKSADASGMPSMKVLTYTVQETAQNAPITAPSDQTVNYATKADLDALRGQIESLKMRLGKLAKKEGNDE